MQLARVYFDEQLIQLRLTVCDGLSEFTNEVYVCHENLSQTVGELTGFQKATPPACHDIRFGEFGPEYGAAFQARLRLAPPGRLLVSCRQESDFEEFGGDCVASSAAIHLVSEPGLLDRFVSELALVAAGMETVAPFDGPNVSG